MTGLLAQRWYVMAARGVAAVAFGLLALFWPAITAGVLALLFGAYALADGVLALGTALGGSGREDRRVLGLEGLLDVVAGGVVLVWRDITPRGLLYVVAAWAIGTGVSELIAAVRVRREADNDALLVASGAASVLTGLVLALRPDAPVLAVAWLIGAYSLAFGSMLVNLGFRLRSAGRVEVESAESTESAEFTESEQRFEPEQTAVVDGAVADITAVETVETVERERA